MKKRNISGSRVMQARRSKTIKRKELCKILKSYGVIMNCFSLFLLEHHMRIVYDFELYFLAKALNTTMDWLLARSDNL